MPNRTVYTTITGQRHLDREHQRAIRRMALAPKPITLAVENFQFTGSVLR